MMPSRTGRATPLEMLPNVLARALEPFPAPVRTLDALHLASIEFLRGQGQTVELASYDDRLIHAAKALGAGRLDQGLLGYWAFLERQASRFARNPQMAVPIAALRKLSPATRDDHRRQAQAWRERARGELAAASISRSWRRRGLPGAHGACSALSLRGDCGPATALA